MQEIVWDPGHGAESIYGALATQIARIMRGLCDYEIAGRPSFHHCSENNMDAPCDMLARLGVMKDETVAHSFAPDWSPFSEAMLARHPGEPSSSDLVLGLAFLTESFPDDARRRNAACCIATDLEGGSKAAASRYRIWALQGACNLLMRLEAGSWNQDGRFLPKGDFDIESYWRSRLICARRLGDEKLLYPDTPGSEGNSASGAMPTF
ncbi:hypothetical protein [Methylocystis heyeri]|uniref:Uncharacterized protein n=1 Tax=Methylocystis heyeri TaxID=391905 RepID=A0A6B8KDT7_9HYPH|nr:hypothetical protein [Methylocystis heyeri]QGM44593.1 hypothetical protein H2LOC_002195 [Methylocystis heyeri]